MSGEPVAKAGDLNGEAGPEAVFADRDLGPRTGPRVGQIDGCLDLDPNFVSYRWCQDKREFVLADDPRRLQAERGIGLFGIGRRFDYFINLNWPRC